MRNKKVLEMTSMAMFIAIIFVMALVPYLGYIQVFAISATIIHTPVIIGALFGGRKFGLGLGLAFGVSSFLVAIMRGATPFDLMFINPILSVLPRILFGLLIWYVYALLKRFMKTEVSAVFLTFLIASILHTILVMGTALLLTPFYEDVLGAELFNFILTALPLIALIEALFAALVGTPIVMRLMESNLFNRERQETLESINE